MIVPANSERRNSCQTGLLYLFGFFIRGTFCRIKSIHTRPTGELNDSALHIKTLKQHHNCTLEMFWSIAKHRLQSWLFFFFCFFSSKTRSWFEWDKRNTIKCIQFILSKSTFSLSLSLFVARYICKTIKISCQIFFRRMTHKKNIDNHTESD